MVKEASSCEENGIDWVSGTGWSSPQCRPAIAMPVPSTLVLSFNVLPVPSTFFQCAAALSCYCYVSTQLWYLSFNMMWYCTQLPFLPIAALVPSVLSIVGTLWQHLSMLPEERSKKGMRHNWPLFRSTMLTSHGSSLVKVTVSSEILARLFPMH